MEIKEQVDVARTSQTSTDKKASPKDTLETYKAKYPDQAEDLETMLGRLQALKNFVDKNLNDLEDYAKLAKTIKGLFDTSVHTFESGLTQKEKQFTTLVDFTIDVAGVEQLKLFVQHCFQKFSHPIKKSPTMKMKKSLAPRNSDTLVLMKKKSPTMKKKLTTTSTHVTIVFIIL